MSDLLVVGAGMAVVALIAFFIILQNFLFVCRPNELLVITGRSSKAKDGSKLNYTVIDGGFCVRKPFVETIDRMDLTTMEVEVSARNAFCKGGIRIDVDSIANVKISGDSRTRQNAIERFLGRPRHEISDVGKQTLEGHLRSVLANLTPEEVNEDRLKFAENLSEEAELDLNKLGIHLDTFNIHSVSDVKESSYLKEIGRKAIAEVIKDAEMAEAEFEREATQAEAGARSRSEVAAERAETEIKTKSNNLRKVKADLEAAAKSVEEEAEAARQTARAVAEQELQQVRAALEEKRLQAEVVVRAEAETRAKAFRARGKAAPIAERGKAMAGSLDMVRQAWVAAGDGAKPIFMIQQLDTILRDVVKQVGRINVGNVSLVDRGDGSSLPSYVASFPATVNAVLRELDGVTGIDIVGTLGNDDRGRDHGQRNKVKGGAE